MIDETADAIKGTLCGLLVVLLLALALGGCPHPLPAPGPGVEAGAASCESVCAHEAELGCDAARPTGKGASCVEVCLNVQSSTVVKWNLACRAHAPSCAEIDRCEAK